MKHYILFCKFLYKKLFQIKNVYFTLDENKFLDFFSKIFRMDQGFL